MRRRNGKPRSGNNGIYFFQVRAVGLTIAYKEVRENEFIFDVAWKADQDDHNSMIARKIALSRLKGKIERGTVCLNVRSVDGKVRNGIIRAVDYSIADGMYSSETSEFNSIRERWNRAKTEDGFCKFIQTVCS